jgi:hypothetical protein
MRLHPDRGRAAIGHAQIRSRRKFPPPPSDDRWNLPQMIRQWSIPVCLAPLGRRLAGPSPAPGSAFDRARDAGPRRVRQVAILIPAGPVRGFLSQIAAFSLALRRLEWRRWHPVLHVFLGGEDNGDVLRERRPHLRDVVTVLVPLSVAESESFLWANRQLHSLGAQRCRCLGKNGRRHPAPGRFRGRARLRRRQ